jgi:hypothetical protein
MNGGIINSITRLHLVGYFYRVKLEDVLQGELYSIPLEITHNLRESIPRRIQTALQVNGGPTQK